MFQSYCGHSHRVSSHVNGFIGLDISPQAMAHDRYLYDHKTMVYTVNRFLDDLYKRYSYLCIPFYLIRYGGIDSVLIWPTYPNMGIDNRNQFDLVRAMPGGKQFPSCLHYHPFRHFCFEKYGG